MGESCPNSSQPRSSRLSSAPGGSGMRPRTSARWPRRRGAWPGRSWSRGDPTHPNGTRSAPDHVRLLGCLAPAQVAEHLARAAIYCLPARYEPFGLSALEAGMSGCALVLGDIPSLREVWGDAALFVPPDDPDALRVALCRLIENASLSAGDGCARPFARPDLHAGAYGPGILKFLPGAASGERRLRLVYFTHSLQSDWNHGNAHFLRGVLTEMQARGHDVRVFEPEDAWSRQNLLADAGPSAVEGFRQAYPTLESTRYDLRTISLDAALDGGGPGPGPRVEPARPGPPHRRAPCASGRLQAAVPRHAPPGRHRPQGRGRLRPEPLRRRPGLRECYPRPVPPRRLERAGLDLARGGGHARFPPAPRRSERRRLGLDRQLGRRRADPGAARVPSGTGPRAGPEGARPRCPLPAGGDEGAGVGWDRVRRPGCQIIRHPKCSPATG